jgi:hypothetical protein
MKLIEFKNVERGKDYNETRLLADIRKSRGIVKFVLEYKIVNYWVRCEDVNLELEVKNFEPLVILERKDEMNDRCCWDRYVWLDIRKIMRYMLDNEVEEDTTKEGRTEYGKSNEIKHYYSVMTQS